MAGPSQTVYHLASVLAIGLLLSCVVLSHLKPDTLNPTHLERLSNLKKSSPHTTSFLASRAAIRATQATYTVRGVVDRLLSPWRGSSAYHFHEEVYTAHSAAPEGAEPILLPSRHASWVLDDAANATAAAAPEEPDVWSPFPVSEASTRTEIEEIFAVSLPLILFFSALFVAVEAAAMLARRGRDWMLQNSDWADLPAAAQAQVRVPQAARGGEDAWGGTGLRGRACLG